MKYKRFKAKKVKPKFTGRVIDMTRPTWGWNTASMCYDEKKRTYRFAIWCSPRPKPGDRILFSGDRYLHVTEVEYCRDPMDMAFITGEEVLVET